ncbi:tyrosine-type recombinase/integrase [Propionimicrobium sp. PCR01-08-3]|uniref:tyrosine-type recombinase/integrase n=1 Tax=Propionimicrobium sp. PCR01-08-3 TaxID=3052086 RepID=UPI00255C7DA2|nr:tyrosine-type recombinase/integrase [Propionimicrobium sp. PCR01-08-3]WIY83018.1 tyrosine-type recombinase/integrase [Propionimicrobium sp. PCR01-08-3]
MANGLYRRCGCRDENGRQYGNLPQKPSAEQRANACPKMLTDPKHGRWSYRVSNGYDPQTGKRRVINGRSYPTLKQAQTALNADRVAKDQGRLRKPSETTLAAYAPIWLERRTTMGARPLKATTAAQYRAYLVNDIIPQLGHVKIAELRRSHVQSFVDDLAKDGRGAVTIKRIVATLQSVLTGAVKDGLIETNIARSVDTPTVQKETRTIWSPDDVARFFQAVSTDRLGPMYELTLYAALRRGEVCGLRWDDVDFTEQTLTIQHNRVRVGGVPTEQTPKTASSAAVVALSAPALEALKAWRFRQDLERQDAGDAWASEGHVFTDELGGALDPQLPTYWFGKIVKAQGLPPMTFHGLRHVAATLIWESGADILHVSKALRHSSIGVTSTVYTHMKESEQRATFEAIANQLSEATAHTSHTQSTN